MAESFHSINVSPRSEVLNFHEVQLLSVFGCGSHFGIISKDALLNTMPQTFNSGLASVTDSSSHYGPIFWLLFMPGDLGLDASIVYLTLLG